MAEHSQVSIGASIGVSIGASMGVSIGVSIGVSTGCRLAMCIIRGVVVIGVTSVDAQNARRGGRPAGSLGFLFQQLLISAAAVLHCCTAVL